MTNIKNDFNTGHAITIVIFIVGIIVSGVTNYYAVKFSGQANSIKISALQNQLQVLNDKIENMDDRYVLQKEFNSFKNNTSSKLSNIDDNVNYLIRLQIERSNNNAQGN